MINEMFPGIRMPISVIFFFCAVDSLYLVMILETKKLQLHNFIRAELNYSSVTTCPMTLYVYTRVYIVNQSIKFAKFMLLVLIYLIT